MDRLKFYQALAHLTTRQRAILIARDYEGMQCKEIAAIAGHSLQSIKKYVQSGRRAFWQAYKGA
jgi:DNA-directed RNA polymerase specialized sigma24 family protein